MSVKIIMVFLAARIPRKCGNGEVEAVKFTIIHHSLIHQSLTPQGTLVLNLLFARNIGNED